MELPLPPTLRAYGVRAILGEARAPQVLQARRIVGELRENSISEYCDSDAFERFGALRSTFDIGQS